MTSISDIINADRRMYNTKCSQQTHQFLFFVVAVHHTEISPVFKGLSEIVFPQISSGQKLKLNCNRIVYMNCKLWTPPPGPDVWKVLQNRLTM